jgi:hypothetical protein
MSGVAQNNGAIQVLYGVAGYGRQIAALMEPMELEKPSVFYLPYVSLAYARFFSGNFTEAASAVARASTVSPRFSVPRYLRTGDCGDVWSPRGRFLKQCQWIMMAAVIAEICECGCG